MRDRACGTEYEKIGNLTSFTCSHCDRCAAVGDQLLSMPSLSTADGGSMAAGSSPP